MPVNSPIGGIIGGGTAACFAVPFTHFFEVTKVQYQLAGNSELAPVVQNKSILKFMQSMVQQNGAIALYRGMGTAFCYQFCLNGMRLGTYNPIRERLTLAVYQSTEMQSTPINFFAGACSGAMGATLASPFFLVKTRLQAFTSPLRTATQKHNYRNGWDGFKQIVGKDGPRGLVRGTGPSIFRTVLGSTFQLPAYYFFKRRFRNLLKEGTFLHMLSSGCSAVVVCVIMHPADTVMSMMYDNTGKQYKNVLECLRKNLQTKGVLGFYRGFLPHLVRIVPYTVITLATAEYTIAACTRMESQLRRGMRERKSSLG